jgi:hypothetical protein
MRYRAGYHSSVDSCAYSFPTHLEVLYWQDMGQILRVYGAGGCIFPPRCIPTIAVILTAE